MHGSIGAVVLAAGAARRFGGIKLLAPLDGRPVLQHVLDALAEAGIDAVVVVLGDAATEIERSMAWRRERRVRNPDPARGLASSLAIGIGALAPDVTAAIIALGDQPRTSPDVVRALIAAPIDPSRPVVVPRYADDTGRNPVLLRRAAFGRLAEASGDRGLGPFLAAHPELVEEIPVPGANPDVDRPRDLSTLVEAGWSARVRANREQVERIREVPDDDDFYAPGSSLFRADPDRTDEPVLDLLRSLVEPADVWLDVGAGAGRYALPLARLSRQVIALDASAAMLEALAEDAARHVIGNVTPILARWPPRPDDEAASTLGPLPCADAALMAHIGYDIEAIGPFVDAFEAATRRRCVAILMERQPSSIADVCWPVVHGQERIALPGLPSFVELLRARGRAPEVTMLERQPRLFDTREVLEAFIRRQLWIASDGEADRRFRRAFDESVIETHGRFGLRGQPSVPLGVVTWVPPATG